MKWGQLCWCRTALVQYSTQTVHVNVKKTKCRAHPSSRYIKTRTTVAIHVRRIHLGRMGWNGSRVNVPARGARQSGSMTVGGQHRRRRLVTEYGRKLNVYDGQKLRRNDGVHSSSDTVLTRRDGVLQLLLAGGLFLSGGRDMAVASDTVNRTIAIPSEMSQAPMHLSRVRVVGICDVSQMQEDGVLLDGRSQAKVVATGTLWGTDYVVSSYAGVEGVMRRGQIGMVVPSDAGADSMVGYRLEVVGSDPSLDMVVLRIQMDEDERNNSNDDDDDDDNSANGGSSDSANYSSTSKKGIHGQVGQMRIVVDPMVGQQVYIKAVNDIGHSWLGSGVVSAVERDVRARNGQMMHHVVQTDVPLTKEAAGGVLLDQKGDLLGMITPGDVSFETELRYDSGVHFAVGGRTLVESVPNLIQYGNSRGKR